MGFTHARVGFCNAIGNSFSSDFSVVVSSLGATLPVMFSPTS